MENFRQKVKKRIGVNLALAAVSLIVAAVVCVKAFGAEQGFLPVYIAGVEFGLFITFFAYLIFGAARDARALGDEEKLRALHIAESDERTRFIEEKMGKTALNALIVALILAVLLASCFDLTVALTLVGVLLFAAMLRGGLWVYYSCKLSGDAALNRARVWSFGLLLAGLLIIVGETVAGRLADLHPAVEWTLIAVGILLEALGIAMMVRSREK